MEPLLSKFEEENERDSSEGASLSPLNETTTHERIYKSTLLQPNNMLHAGTRVTKVRAETVDDD
jgi:hypothetical protein